MRSDVKEVQALSFTNQVAQRFGLMRSALVIPVLVLVNIVSASNHHATVGLDDLAQRIGEENLPTGEHVHVAQAEGLQSGNYRPDHNASQFDGKQFIWMSGGSTYPSAHATSVGQRFYGSTGGLMPAIGTIYSYDANQFFGNDWLRANLAPTTPPLSPPGQVKVVNHSWVGDAGSLNNSGLRRTDWLVNQFDVLMIAGVGNSTSSNSPLLTHAYNTIAVGRESGVHGASPTGPDVDGPGRMKPEIVAPGGSTSSATPVVASAAAMMVEIARTDDQVLQFPDAERSDVLKAVLLAGAHRDESWSNDPVTDGPDRGRTSTPIDQVFGAGMVNVDRSHRILTAGQQSSSAIIPSQPVGHAGWDRPMIGPNQSRHLRFTVVDPAEEASILITWNRQVNSNNMDSWSIAHFELTLWGLENNQLRSLVGDEGIDRFVAGNVVSESKVDNVQLLHLRDLAPGEYLAEIRRTDSLVGSRPVAIAWLLPEPSEPETPSDLNGDGIVDVADLLILLSAWGECPEWPCPADLTGTGSVGISDLLILLNHWG